MRSTARSCSSWPATSSASSRLPHPPGRRDPRRRVDPAFEIYNVYVERVNERVEHARALLEASSTTPPMRSWLYDREDALSSSRPREELDDAWRKSVKNDALRLHLAGRERRGDPHHARQALRQPSPTRARDQGEDVFQTFMNAYAGAIEPHTGYMTPRTSENFNISDAAVAGRHRRGAAARRRVHR
jgi:carboxyl-terminal processing protease